MFFSSVGRSCLLDFGFDKNSFVGNEISHNFIFKVSFYLSLYLSFSLKVEYKFETLFLF